jgi:uncharacterized protein (DUF427 family)
MTDRPVLEPNAAHPITVEPTGAHVVVRVNGEVVAETDAALTLREGPLPDVQYVPVDDVRRDHLRPSETTTYCPFKGDAAYYDLVGAGDTVADAVWYYAAPYPAVAPIADHVAFYADKDGVEVVVSGAGPA